MHRVNEYEKSDNADTDEDDLSCLELHSITEADRKIIWITTEVSGVKLKMELDTVSALSIIKRLFSNVVSGLSSSKVSACSILIKEFCGGKVD